MMLNEEDEFEVGGEAENEKAALLLSMELKPNIVLLNILLGTANGLFVAKQLLRSCPDARIVLFSGSNDENLLFDALRIGVYGYLQKSLSIDDLRRALRSVQPGERVLAESRAITQVATEFHRLANEQNRRGLVLGSRYIEDVALSSEGCTNREIGKQLFWSKLHLNRNMQDI